MASRGNQEALGSRKAVRPFFLPMTCAGDPMGVEIPATDMQFDFPERVRRAW
jgi:hypothetical protein